MVVKTSIGAPVRLALGVQGDGRAGQATWAWGVVMTLMMTMVRLMVKMLLTWERVLEAVGRVVEAGGRGGAQEVLHLLQRAVGPVEAPRGSPQVAHHVSVLPWAGLGPW